MTEISDDELPLFTEIDNQTDRAAGVVGGGFVDSALKKAIEAELFVPSNTNSNKLFKGYGPISSFSARIEIGFALKIFGQKTKVDLDTIRLIRNQFAHDLNPITFSTPGIKEACNRIAMTRFTPIPDLKQRNVTPERYRYERACKVLVFIFLVRAEELDSPSHGRSEPRPDVPTLP